MPDDFFSPEFERRLQLEEHETAQREARRAERRQRVRRRPCCIPDCQATVLRSAPFPLCTSHMVKVWELVEGRSDLPTSAPTEVADAQRHAAAVKERKTTREANRGWLYVLDTRNGLVKIGWTKDIDRRLSQYPPTFGLVIAIPGTRTEERDIHRSLANSKVSGREWYEVTSEVVRQINVMVAQENVLRARRHSRAMESYNPQWSVAFAPPALEMLPRFTSLEEWETKSIGVFTSERRPAPKSRPAARKV